MHINKWLPWILWPLPAGERYWPEPGRSLLAGVYGELYVDEGETQGTGPQVYDRHMAYLKQVVLKEKLYLFDIEDGWEPLCKTLGKEVPDVSSPHPNETAALSVFLGNKVRLGLIWWIVLISVVAFTVAIAMRYAKFMDLVYIVE